MMTYFVWKYNRSQLHQTLSWRFVNNTRHLSFGLFKFLACCTQIFRSRLDLFDFQDGWRNRIWLWFQCCIEPWPNKLLSVIIPQKGTDFHFLSFYTLFPNFFHHCHFFFIRTFASILFSHFFIFFPFSSFFLAHHVLDIWGGRGWVVLGVCSCTIFFTAHSYVRNILLIWFNFLSTLVLSIARMLLRAFRPCTNFISFYLFQLLMFFFSFDQSNF